MSESWVGQHRASDPSTLERLFGSTDVLPLWIAEPTLPPPPAVREALEARAAEPFYGYEMRRPDPRELFWAWSSARHGWDGTGTSATFSPSIGTTIAVLLELLTDAGDGVILQPPVFTDFKPLVRRANREPITNPLVDDGDRYTMDLDHLEAIASEPTTRFMILCNPHNPVGRAWSEHELGEVARICEEHDVFVFSDEVHGDVILGGRFTPFGTVTSSSFERWAVGTGPIKAFGLAGIADTFVISPDDDILSSFRKVSARNHLVRNNVFGLAATQAAYRDGGPWLDGFLTTIGERMDMLREGLPDVIRLRPAEATYLAWIDLRGLGMDVPALSRWLVDEARLALSPGHWFGREGAGFARMTVAVPEATLLEAIQRLNAAVG